MQLHELRHYHATWLAYQGVPEWAIAIQLGHSSKGTAWALAAELGAGAPRGSKESRNGTTKRYLHRQGLAIQLIIEATAGETIPIPTDPKRPHEAHPEAANEDGDDGGSGGPGR